MKVNSRKEREKMLQKLARQGLKYLPAESIFECMHCDDYINTNLISHAQRHIYTAKHRNRQDMSFLRHEILKAGKTAAERFRIQQEQAALMNETLLRIE